MDLSQLLVELFDRIPPLASGAIDDLKLEQLVTPPAPGANTIAWLLWHTARVEDEHVSELLDVDQLWTQGDWAASFSLLADPSNTGYGHTADDVRAVRPTSPDALLAYLAATSARTNELLATVTPKELNKVVDDRWTPPVTMGVRLVSIADDCLQHVGQAAYVRGLLNA